MRASPSHELAARIRRRTISRLTQLLSHVSGGFDKEPIASHNR
jgi:hypothetical protein